MIQPKARIVSHTQLNHDMWKIGVEASEIASQATPGQFVNVRISESLDPLLRRPLSIYNIFKLDDEVLGLEIVYKVVGRGTRLMSQLKVGDYLDIMGPLGQGFKLDKKKKDHVILGKGCGTSCLYLLGQELSNLSAKGEIALHIMLGSKTKNSMVFEQDFAALNGSLQFASDDGTYGYHGYLTDILQEGLEKGTVSSECIIYACGPEKMYRALAKLCQKFSVSSQIAIERNMLCGIGGCYTCVCSVNKKGVMKNRDLEASHIQFDLESENGYALTCIDGPVFNIEEVNLNG